MTIVKSSSRPPVTLLCAWVFLILFLISSCTVDNDCEIYSHDPPELELLDYPGNVIDCTPDSMLTLHFSMKAEAGLNTFSMNGEPICVFTKGEKELVFEYSRYFWESEELHFLLYDQCNQEAILPVQLNVLPSL